VTQPWIVGVTGASGAPYAVRLLRALVDARTPVQLIVSSHGWRLFDTEVGIDSLDGLKAATGGMWDHVTVFDNADRGATPASGSAQSAGMVICPCSMGTLSAIAAGSSRSLVERAADVALKERRKLIVVTRETPLSLVHLRNMTTLAEAGAVVMPAAPGFYHRPKKVGDLVDFMVQRVLDHMGVDADLVPRWES
jgi:flavin prenyltransferase